jgi:TetR/AcrR family transcriptional regulator of autoinduction and epiphytic fitness
VSETVVTDGRVSRAERTRTAVVDALLELIDEGNLRPTAREVADRAGVSLRSVYVHFDDVESLFVAASARHFEHVQALHLPCDPEAGLDARIDRLVESRLRIYTAGAQVRRAAVVQEPFSPALRNALDYGRRTGRAEIDTVFAPELQALGPDDRTALRATLEVALSASTWDTLTSNPDVPPAGVAALMGGLVRAALSALRGEGSAAAPATQHRDTGNERPPPTSAGLG